MNRKRKKNLNIMLVAIMLISLVLPNFYSNHVTAAGIITVADAIKNNTGTATVEGYIVGYVTATNAITQDPSKFKDDNNYAIADSPTETDAKKILPVQLTTNFRAAHGLKTNPGNVGKKVQVTGDLTAYFSMPGLKNPTAMEFVTVADPTKVADVTASPEAGAVAKGTKVTLQTATADAEIYYTTDGTEPTADSTLYSTPIEITKDMTIKAIAVKDGLDNSDVTTYAYTILNEKTIAEVRAMAPQSIGANVKTSGVVTAVIGRTIFFQDETAGIVAYTPTDSTTIFPGDNITVSGVLAEFSTLLEINVEHKDIIVNSKTAVPTAEEVKAADLKEEKEGMLLKVKNVEIGAFSGGNYTATDADGTSFQIRPGSQAWLTQGTAYEEITGVLSANKGVYQLIPRNEGDIVKDSSIVQSVVATPGAGMVKSGTEITLATGTEGAVIHYTLDGTVPTKDSAVYSQPIVIDKAKTIKAIAVKEGMTNSPVATFDYLIQEGAIHIYDIQGKTHSSILNGKTVTDVEGVVTYVDGTSRFFMQDVTGDGDNSTSDGILVFKSSHGLSVGDTVKVTGKVDEYVGEGYAEKADTDLTITEIAATTVEKTGTASLPAPIKLGVDRIAPKEIIDNDQFAVFDPEEDAIDFWESIEGMYVQVDNPKVIALQKDALVWVVPENYPTDVVGGGLKITATDTNPDRIAIDVRNGSTANKSYRAKMGDYFTGAVKGIVNYGYSSYKVMAQEKELPTLTETPIVRNATEIQPAADKLTIGTYNVENFSTQTADEKVGKIADAIVKKMKSPDIIGLNEIQDNNGETDNGVVEGTQSAQKIIDKVIAIGGPTYAYTEVAPVNNQDGGAPGGNIRVAFLYNKDRVSLTQGAQKGTATQAVGFENGKLTFNPGRIDPTNEAFRSSRKPLAAQFDFNGQSIIVVANHFNSKGGDQPLMGKNQPPVLSSEIQRHKIAAIVNNFVKDVKAKDANANVVLLGDFNDFEFTKTLEIAKGNEMTNMIDKVPAEKRYNYSYQGNAQELDHVLVTNNMVENTTVDILHINSGFMEVHGRASDHDPVIIQTSLKKAGEVLPPVDVPANTKTYKLNNFKTKKLTVSNAAVDITVSADSVITEGIVLKSAYAKLQGEGLKNTTLTISPTQPGAIIDLSGVEVKEVIIDNANISQIRGAENVQKWTIRDGVDATKIKIANKGGEVLTSPFLPKPVNHAPVVSSVLPNQSVQVGTPVTINLNNHFSDPDGDSLTYTATAGTVQGSTLTISTPLEGSFPVTVTATDGAAAISATFSVTVTAVPANEIEPYYKDAAGKTGKDLKAALHNIIKVQTKLTYAQVTEALKKTDEDPANSNNVILLYTGRSQAKTTFGSGVNDWNREHVWAKSHGNFGTSTGPGTDIHHLRPTDASVNSTRGHLDFDEGGKSQGECADCNYDGDSFEPPNRVKGDVARMLMYMAVRYEGDGGELDLELADKVNTYPTPFHGKLSVLLKWSKQDPPDAFEKHRNDVIQSIQGNRNPFIDHPEWAESIWPAS